MSPSPLGFLRSKPVIILTLVLIAQTALVYGLGYTRKEAVPEAKPLSELQRDFGPWKLEQVSEMEPEVSAVLKADDTTTRLYRHAETGRLVSLFIAYFETQKTGKAPHSPKNCLPGSGWMPMVSDVVPIDVPGEAQPIRVNRYIVARREGRNLVFYWYQTHNRVIASEYAAKIYLVADSMRYNRTDTSLVRVTLPATGMGDEDAMKAAVEFVRAMFPAVKAHLPA